MEFCREVTSSGRAAAMLAEAMDSPDPIRRDKALLLCVNYSLGTPTSRVEVKAPQSLDEMLIAWDKERATLPPQPEEPSKDDDDKGDA